MILKSKDKNFTKHKRPISKKYIDINEKVVSNKVSFGKKGFKYFIGYKKIGSLSILLSKVSAYRRDFDDTRVARVAFHKNNKYYSQGFLR